MRAINLSSNVGAVRRHFRIKLKINLEYLIFKIKTGLKLLNGFIKAKLTYAILYNIAKTKFFGRGLKC